MSLPEDVFNLAQHCAPLRAVFHMGQSLEFPQQFALLFVQLAGRLHPALALALGTQIGDYAPCALACGTSARNTEKALLIANLSPASAGTASDWSFAGRCA